MGIKGLWRLLEPTAEPVTLESLEGKCLAVGWYIFFAVFSLLFVVLPQPLHLSIWAYQAEYGYSGRDVDSRSPHLSLLVNRLAKLLFYKIRPVFVFDGPNVPQFKQKILNERQIKRHIDDLTLSKARKRFLKQIVHREVLSTAKQEASNAEKAEQQNDRNLQETNECNHSANYNNVDDVFNLPMCSKIPLENEAEKFEKCLNRDERVDYLLAFRNRARGGLTIDEIPDDSKTFSNFQIQRLLQRNQINEQLDELKREALGISLADSNTGNVKLMVMEGLQREHLITTDDDVQVLNKYFGSWLIVDDCKYERKMKENDMLYSLSWPNFLEKNKISDTAKKASFSGANRNKMRCKKLANSDDDEDEDLKEAIALSLEENKWFNSKKMLKSNAYSEFFSKEDAINRMSQTFFENQKILRMVAAFRWNLVSFISNFIAKLLTFVQDWIPQYVKMFSKPITTANNLIMKSNVENLNFQRGPKKSEKTAQKHMMHVCKNMVYLAESEWFQELLRICGIPFIVAPGEAEAQCCELERLGLVQGIISDDSDVWLFGAVTVYKNMFNQKRRLQLFTSKNISKQLGLSKWEMIAIGMLSGGDYTKGLTNIGIVTALELIAEFSQFGNKAADEKYVNFLSFTYYIKAFNLLKRISDWIINENVDKDMMEHADGGKFFNSNRKEKKGFENAFRKKLRRLVEANNEKADLQKFPSFEIFSAYVHPSVDSSLEKFVWRVVNIRDLEIYVWSKLGWDSNKFKNRTQNCFEKWNEYLNPLVGGAGRSYQMHISAFTHKLYKSEADQCMNLTSRARNALKRLADIKNIQLCPSSVLLSDQSNSGKNQENDWEDEQIGDEKLNALTETKNLITNTAESSSICQITNGCSAIKPQILKEKKQKQPLKRGKSREMKRKLNLKKQKPPKIAQTVELKLSEDSSSDPD
ncbi:unnamed protein product [Dracunculus medinensis]|uniref:XPGN domain-containing protein n=1 Tax=Dracunculus medinensis TaxID=318479 RepID=A0A0N4UBW0_DRAME|nr:unnamed protein product [Dracunculus medinensis]